MELKEKLSRLSEREWENCEKKNVLAGWVRDHFEVLVNAKSRIELINVVASKKKIKPDGKNEIITTSYSADKIKKSRLVFVSRLFTFQHFAFDSNYRQIFQTAAVVLECFRPDRKKKNFPPDLRELRMISSLHVHPNLFRHLNVALLEVQWNVETNIK